MSLKVAYLSHALVEHDYRFLQALNSQPELEIVLITLAQSIPDEFRVFSRIKIIGLRHPFFPVDDPSRPEYGFSTRWRTWVGFRWYAKRLKEILREEEIQVLHAGWVQVDGLLAKFAKFKPLLLMPWGSDILINPDRSWRTRYLTRSILKQSSYITCDNETVRRKILEIYPAFPSDRFLVMPWGVDLDQFSPPPTGLQLKPLRLIMTRQFRPVYNIPFFLEVVAQLRRKMTNFEVIMIGQGPERPRIEEKIKELHLENVVTLKGYVPNDQLANQLRSASLYVSTSLSDGSSVSLLEAMACGLPCVVSDHPSNHSWVQEGMNGVLIDPRLAIDAADKIAKLINSPSQLVSMGKASRKIAEEKADWGRNVTKLAALYEKLASSEQSSA